MSGSATRAAGTRTANTALTSLAMVIAYGVSLQVAIVGELQDYFRRRADVELEHSKNLERLAKALLQKQKQEKQRRDQWSLCSVFSLYQKLVQVTKKQSRDHAVLGELLQSNLVNRLEQTGEDLSRIYRRVRRHNFELRTVINSLWVIGLSSLIFSVAISAWKVMRSYSRSITNFTLPWRPTSLLERMPTDRDQIPISGRVSNEDEEYLTGGETSKEPQAQNVDQRCRQGTSCSHKKRRLQES